MSFFKLLCSRLNYFNISIILNISKLPLPSLNYELLLKTFLKSYDATVKTTKHYDHIFLFFFFFCETEFLYVALGILELSMYTKLGSSS